MPDMNRRTGEALDGAAAVRQSIEDILTTPIGSRVMRPAYGSRIPDMIDDMATPGTAAAMAAEVVDALARWEPRFDPAFVSARPADEPGRVLIDVSGRLIETPAQETLAAEVRI